MRSKVFPFLLMAAALPWGGLLAGCSGADNPKLKDAPLLRAEPPEKPESQAIPGRGTYGSSDEYQKAMERGANR